MKRAIVGLLLVTAVVPVAGEAAKPPKNNSVSIRATSPIVWGKSTAITGKVAGQGAGGTVVELEADEFPFADNGFTKVATVAAANNGDYRFVAKPGLNTRFRVNAKSSPPVTSSIATVLVRIRVKLALSDSTPRRGRVVRFSGTACPEHDGKLAYIQKRGSSGRFSTVSRTTLKDAPGTSCSNYAKGVRIRSDGTYRVIVLSKDQDHLTGVSRRVSIDAH